MPEPLKKLENIRNRFENLMWAGIGLGTLSDILGFKTYTFIFGAITLVGLVGWLSLRSTLKKRNDTAPKDDA